MCAAVQVVGFLWGLFNGCFIAVDFAIAIDTIPDKGNTARFLGNGRAQTARAQCRRQIAAAAHGQGINEPSQRLRSIEEGEPRACAVDEQV